MKKNRVDELANQLEKRGQTDRIEAALHAFDLSGASEAERESWYHLRGITAFQRGDREEARRRLREAREQFPRSGSIAFSLGQEEEYAGDVDRAFALFHELRFPGVPSAFILAAARYAYLWDRYAEGLAMLESIFDAYEKLGIVDDHFLYMRGLPFFGSTWSTAGTLHKLLGNLDVLRDRTKKWASKLHDYDFDRLLQQLDFETRHDLAGCARVVRARVAEFEKEKWPSGYHRTELAVLEARLADSLVSADAILHGVRLGANDHRWLADVLLLARCEAHERFGKPDEGLISEFLRKQVYLFEPEHVFHFHLVDYQERLKPRYRAPRMARQR